MVPVRASRRPTKDPQALASEGLTTGSLAGIRYDPDDASRSDLDLQQREITVRGKGSGSRIVRIGHEAARALDRYIRIRSKHAQAWRPQLWLGVNNRGLMTANGIYQMIARRGRQCGVDAWPHRFRHHFGHTSLDRGGAEGDLMELNGWSSPQRLAAMAPALAVPGSAAPTTASWPAARDSGCDPPAPTVAATRRQIPTWATSFALSKPTLLPMIVQWGIAGMDVAARVNDGPNLSSFRRSDLRRGMAPIEPVSWGGPRWLVRLSLSRG
jgi:hypothetical protein